MFTIELPLSGAAFWIAFLVTIVLDFVIGRITKYINECKGYTGGFWTGFIFGFIGLAIIINKPDINPEITKYEDEYLNNRLMTEGGWKCANCGNVNASYATSCTCGLAKADNKKFLAKKQASEKSSAAKASPADEIAKFKKLLDDGVISEEEFAAKKKQLLGL